MTLADQIRARHTSVALPRSVAGVPPPATDRPPTGFDERPDPGATPSWPCRGLTTVRTVLQLVGSPTDAFSAELSWLYARGALDAVADPARYRTHVAHVAHDRTWTFPPGNAAVDLAAALARIGALRPDVVVPQLFCRAGMTAHRALFDDVLGVPVVGNPAAMMALAADKPLAGAVVAAAGVDVPESEMLTAGQRPLLAPPVVVRPADADNSVGTTLVAERAEYPDALAAAFAHSPRALVSRFVPPGREVRCGVLERGEALEVLPLEEYPVDGSAPIRVGADKLARADDGTLSLMAKAPGRSWTLPPDDPLTATVGAAARRAHTALGGRDYGLFDFRIDPDGRPWFLEASPYCSFSPASVLAVMAAAGGITLPDLFADLVERAARRGPP